MFRRLAAVTASGVLAAAGFVLAPATPALAATCSGTVAQDFDDDGRADLVAARTLPAGQAGVVDIIMTGGTIQTISASDLGSASAADDQFGASVHIASFDRLDNCPDLAIGAPGSAGGGAVYLVRGNGAGVDTASAHRIASPAAGARFGATVGIVDQSLSGPHLLAGAPGLEAGAAAEAGGVYLSALSGGVTSGSPVMLTYTDFGAPPAAGDHLGAVMDTFSWHLTLGVPDRDLGAATDAGEVISASLVDQVGVLAVSTWARANQDSQGAPGVAEAGDHFGASLDAAGGLVLVGVPGEDVGKRRDAGMAMQYADLGGHAVGNWKAWTQNSRGIPGTAEAGDAFGSAVHYNWFERLVDGDPVAQLVPVVGAPGEDIGKVKDAGDITVIPGVRKAFELNQNTPGLPGKAEAGDRMGAALGDLPGRYHGAYHDGDGLLVGAPGEDEGKVRDAGKIMQTEGLVPKGTFTWKTAKNLGEKVPDTRYGWTIPGAS
jgi:hypothetical protein